MTKESDTKPFYWNSTQHLYGCYGAIIVCILALLNISTHGWFKASVYGYFFGLAVYWSLHVIQQLSARPQPQPIIVKDIEPLDQTNIDSASMPSPTAQMKRTSEQQLLQHFSLLHQQVINLIPTEANHKFQNIHALLVIITQKIRRSNNQNTQTEILNIQRIINNYISPLIEHYQELPVIFHDRKMADELSPNELLLKQLNLIHDEVLKITEHVFHDDVEALIQHGEFLQQKLNPPHFFQIKTSSSDLSLK